MELQSVGTNLSTRNNSQVAFGAARFTKIKTDEYLGCFERLCKNNLPKLDEFTHKHDVALRIKSEYTPPVLHLSPDSFFTMKVILKVKETPKNMLEKFTNLFKKSKKLVYHEIDTSDKTLQSPTPIFDRLSDQLQNADFEKDLKNLKK